jgi:1-acyl-sn-glycerol-3-phosphate acyltransferase
MDPTAGRAPAERLDAFYATVRLVARFWLWFFFKRVEVRHPERLPAGGPALLCINHPNNLIDSLLVGAVLRRKVHYLATAALFRNPVVARFLSACGAIPVYRRQDDAARMGRNDEMFEACFRALGRGRVIGIYPEGTTHSEARVQRIKTGAARIALEYEARRAGGPAVVMIPVGLTFEARKSFRGRVRVSFGEPVAVEPYRAVYREDAPKAVDALTTAIQWAMEAEIVNAARTDRAEVARAVDEIYRPDLARALRDERGLSAAQIDSFRLSQSIADAVAHFETREPERVERLWRQIEEYRALLAAWQVRDPAVRARLQRRSVAERLRRSGVASAGLPLFAYGALVNLLPYALPRWLARRVATKETSYATTRLLASIAAFPLFWSLETWLVFRLAGPVWALAFLATLPLSGLAAYRYLGGLGRLRGQLRMSALALTRGHAAARLTEARRALVAELERATADYLAATKGSSF